MIMQQKVIKFSIMILTLLLTLTIYIPEWARAGYAYIHVNIFDKDPAEGGSPWCPEYVTEIYILPEP